MKDCGCKKCDMKKRKKLTIKNKKPKKSKY